MSYNIIKNNFDNLVEGIEFIQSKYPYYDKDKLEDTYTNTKYTVQMVQNSIHPFIQIQKFYEILIFDVLIGNSDRHHSNWGIMSTKTKWPNDLEYVLFKLSPIYDNGSSLCAYEDSNNVDIFFKDNMKKEALLNTKSKSVIGWEDKRPIRHFELLERIKETSYAVTIKYIKKLKDNITEVNIDNILMGFSDDIINKNMKKLLKLFILERRKRILEIYNLKDEV